MYYPLQATNMKKEEEEESNGKGTEISVKQKKRKEKYTMRDINSFCSLHQTVTQKQKNHENPYSKTFLFFNFLF